jgi:hypothetical protein
MTIRKIIACGHSQSAADSRMREFAHAEALTKCALPVCADARIETTRPWLLATALPSRVSLVELVEAQQEHGYRST